MPHDLIHKGESLEAGLIEEFCRSFDGLHPIHMDAIWAQRPKKWERTCAPIDYALSHAKEPEKILALAEVKTSSYRASFLDAYYQPLNKVKWAKILFDEFGLRTFHIIKFLDYSPEHGRYGQDTSIHYITDLAHAPVLNGVTYDNNWNTKSPDARRRHKPVVCIPMRHFQKLDVSAGAGGIPRWLMHPSGVSVEELKAGIDKLVH